MKKQKPIIMKTEWNFSIFYKNENDAQIEKDISDFSSEVSRFEKKYRNDLKYLSDAESLLSACGDYEKLIAQVGCTKPRMYFYFLCDKFSDNKKFQARMVEIESVFDRLMNKIVFFGLNLAKIPVDKQKQFLSDKKLSKYKYFLENIFENAKYNLSEAEEKIVNLFNQPAREMWIRGVEKSLNQKEIVFKGKKMPITQGFATYYSLPKKDRRDLWDLLMKKMRELSDFAEAEMNALMYKKKIEDELRGFTKPYSSTIAHYQNEEKTVEGLIGVVTKNFSVAHRFYKIKAKLLKEKSLQYADRSAQVGETSTKFLFADAVSILKNAFGRFGEKYSAILDQYLINGHIDVFSKKGKRGGAYCWGSYATPTFVLLNHANNFNSVMTFGHEMGHAFHSESSKSQPRIYTDYTISVAEVASTFFENLVFEEAFSKLSSKEKIIAMHDRLSGKIATVFRQVACFNFENEIHTLQRKNGQVSKEEMASLMNTHMKSYLGPIFKLKESDGYFFVDWLHLRNHFYVYAYAFGELISDALYFEYKKNPEFKVKVEEFLSAGGSKKPEDIFASIGVDIRDPKFFEKGIQKIREDVAEFEKLVKIK